MLELVMHNAFMSNVDVRQQKAVEIADKFRIVESSGKWIENNSGPAMRTRDTYTCSVKDPRSHRERYIRAPQIDLCSESQN